MEGHIAHGAVPGLALGVLRLGPQHWPPAKEDSCLVWTGSTGPSCLIPESFRALSGKEGEVLTGKRVDCYLENLPLCVRWAADPSGWSRLYCVQQEAAPRGQGPNP